MRLVLADEEARGWLEALVHPAVRQEVARWFEALRASANPPTVAVVEAALLVETGAWRDYDRLVVVTAPLELRRARALAGGWSPEQLDRTVAAQTTDAARERVAHHVVPNDGRPRRPGPRRRRPVGGPDALPLHLSEVWGPGSGVRGPERSHRLLAGRGS